jgi:hypothetical protein
MALTPRRWLAALVALLLAGMATVLPPGTARGFIRYLPWGWYNLSRGGAPDSLVLQHNELLRQATLAGERLVLATVRDSLLAQSDLIRRALLGRPQLYRLNLGAPSRPVRRGSTTAGAAGPDRLQSIQAALDSAWRELPRRDSSAWTVIALAQVPLRLFVAGHEANLALPDASEPILYGAPMGRGCVLLVDADRTALPVTEQRLLDRLAPCRWQTAFGAPSDSIGAWLARQSWSVAYPVRSWLTGWGELQVISSRRAQVLADTGAWGESARLAVEWAVWWGAVHAAGCYQGRAESCMRVLRAPERWGWQAAAAVPEDSFPSIRARRVAGGLLLAGLLDDVLAAVGPERFQAFWTSNLSPDSALAVALQQPLAPWLMARVERRLGGHKAEPMLPPASAGVSLVLAGLFVGAGVLASTRRRTA